MQRPGWSNSRPDPGDRSQSVSKVAKPFGTGRYNQQRRLGRKTIVWGCTLTAIGLVLWWMQSQMGTYRQASTSKLAYTRKEADAFKTQLKTLIDETSRESKAAVIGLQPLFKEWQGVKADVNDFNNRLRAAKADMHSIEELHDQRMRSLGKGTEADTQRREYQDEYDKAKLAYGELLEQSKKTKMKEENLRTQVELLRLDIEAFGVALADFLKRQQSEDISPVEGTKQPGNVYDRTLLVETYSNGLTDLKHKHSKRELEEIVAMEGSIGANGLGDGLYADSVEKAAVAASVGEAKVVEKASKSGGSRAMLPQNKKNRQKSMVEDGKHADSQSSTQEDTNVDNDNRQQVLKEVLGKMNSDMGARSSKADEMNRKKEGQNTREQKELPSWLSDRWKEKGNGILGPHDIDDSLRCKKSGLCEGVDSCKIGQKELLGCMKTADKRLEAVREAASWSWEAYKQFAFGRDELKPLSKSYETWFELGLTLVDSLDTFLLLGMDAEYEEARKWVAFELKLDPDKAVNLFETTIRIVGGLLAAFHLSHGDKTMLYKATSLALRLLPAFDSPTEIPFSDVNLRTHKADPPHWTSYSSLAEVTSLSMEMSYIARATGEIEPSDKAMRTIYKVLEAEDRLDGLAPIYVDTNTARLQGQVITFGARGDSYYEYLLKQWILSGKQDDKLLQGYLEAMRGVRKHLLMRTDHDGLLFVGEIVRHQTPTKTPKMDHLVCFLPGLLALGHHHGLNSAAPGEPNDLAIAEDLMRTCYEMYRRTPTGLAPELAFFDTSEARHGNSEALNEENSGGGDFMIKQFDSHNLLRPETVESLFILKTVTEKQHYQEWAWEIFRAFHMHSLVETGGYANLDSCLHLPPPKRDKMESFWLAETLKYIYLTLDDSSPPVINLNELVFNTEAHPLPVKGSHADSMLTDFYSVKPYQGLQNTTLDTRIQYWESMARDEAGRQAQLGT